MNRRGFFGAIAAALGCARGHTQGIHSAQPLYDAAIGGGPRRCYTEPQFRAAVAAQARRSGYNRDAVWAECERTRLSFERALRADNAQG